MIDDKWGIIGVMDEKQESEVKTNYVDLHPLKKGKRVLLFLADFFIVFFFAVSLFNIAVYPIGKAIANYDTQVTKLTTAQKARDSVLYGYELLFPKNPLQKEASDFQTNLEYTSEEYVHCFVDSSISAKYDVFATYFVSIQTDKTAYLTMLKDLDSRFGFFDFTGDNVVLKQTYINEFKPHFNPRDKMSEQGATDYYNFVDKIFTQGYGRMIKDIEAKDLVLDGISYKQEQSTVTLIVNNFNTLTITTALLSFFLGVFINFFFVPMITKKRKTIGMLFMKIERVRAKNLDTLSLPLVYLNSAYSIAGSALSVIFVPLGLFSFNDLFSLPVLFILSVCSFIYIIASFITLLFDPYNRTLGDLLCQIHCLGEDEFDALIRAKGYSS